MEGCCILVGTKKGQKEGKDEGQERKNEKIEKWDECGYRLEGKKGSIGLEGEIKEQDERVG